MKKNYYQLHYLKIEVCKKKIFFDRHCAIDLNMMYVTNIKYLESVNRHFYFHIYTKHTRTHSLSEMLLRIIYFILSKRVCTFHHHHHQHACIAMYKTHRYYYLMMTRAERAFKVGFVYVFV